MFSTRKATAVAALIILAITGNYLNASAVIATPNYVEGTDVASTVFNPLRVDNFDLEMSDADFESLKSPNVNWEFEGDWRETQMSFTMAGKVYGPYKVGVHLKGAWGSWRDVTQKAAFKIKMDAFVKDQTLFGISKFTLNNMVQDPSYIHETLTYRLYRAMGVPTPRTGYANVTLNGRDYGLHLNIETMDKILLARWGISSSHLYKGAVPYFPDFYEGSESQFAIESGSKTDTSDLTAFMKIQAMRGPAWWTEMGKIADMKQMTLGWAVELYVGHWDGYVMNRNNYFLNFDKTGRVTLLPWGTDQTWNGSLAYFRSPALMINKCWAVPQCKLLYEQALAEVANKAEQLDLQTMAGDVSRAITEAVALDPFGPNYNVVADYQNGTIWRLGNQLSSLQALSAPWDTGLSSITVNGSEFAVGSTIYLPVRTREVSIEAFANEYDARAIVSDPGVLKDGLNNITIQVTSANGKHSRTETVSVYVYKAASTKSSIGFAKSSTKVLSKGSISLDSLITKLSPSKNLVLTVSMPKSKTLSLSKNNVLLKQRTDFILKALTAKGIKATKVTKSLATTGVADSLTVSASFVK
ncbi:MAG: hypothetical protein RIS19_410 [Actinomycetota bacterium]